MVITVSPKATDTPSSPMPTPGNAAAYTALPQPPRTSQKVPMNSAIMRMRSVMSSPRGNEKGRESGLFVFEQRRSNDVQVLDALVQVLVLGHLAVELDVESHLVGRVGEAQRILVADAVGLEQVEQGLVEGLHAEFARLLHDLLDAVDLALEV